MFLLRSFLQLHFVAAFYMIFFTLRDLFTVLRGFYGFVVGELGYCLPVGVLSKLRIFISSCCPVLHCDTNLCNSCTNIVKTAYVKNCFL